MRITTVDQLRAIVGEPMEMAAKKVKPALEQAHVEWLAAAPMVFVATCDSAGRMDVSPKGDPPGKVVHVIDTHTIAIPERPGNRRVDGFLNILQNPTVGTISVVPGRGDTLRINGTARIVDDSAYFDELTVKGQAADPRARDRHQRGVLPLRQGISAVGPVEAGVVASRRPAVRRADHQAPHARVRPGGARGTVRRGQLPQNAVLILDRRVIRG